MLYILRRAVVGRGISYGNMELQYILDVALEIFTKLILYSPENQYNWVTNFILYSYPFHCVLVYDLNKKPSQIFNKPSRRKQKPLFIDIMSTAESIQICNIAILTTRWKQEDLYELEGATRLSASSLTIYALFTQL